VVHLKGFSAPLWGIAKIIFGEERIISLMKIKESPWRVTTLSSKKKKYFPQGIEKIIP
jgi:hypothetical protein